jgi:hypothetical protein
LCFAFLMFDVGTVVLVFALLMFDVETAVLVFCVSNVQRGDCCASVLRF